MACPPVGNQRATNAAATPHRLEASLPKRDPGPRPGLVDRSDDVLVSVAVSCTGRHGVHRLACVALPSARRVRSDDRLDGSGEARSQRGGFVRDRQQTDVPQANPALPDGPTAQAVVARLHGSPEEGRNLISREHLVVTQVAPHQRLGEEVLEAIRVAGADRHAGQAFGS